ncbi:DUF3566 domain-containing protein [Dermatophilaceae bacterium Soc4.6]
MSTTGQGNNPRRPAGSTARPTSGATGSTSTVPGARPVSGQTARPAGGQTPRNGTPPSRPGAKPGTRPVGARPRRPQAARRVRLAVARVDPWSVMKLSFLLAVAAGIAGVVVTMVLWLVLSGMGVFADIDRIIKELLSSSTTSFEIMDYIGFGRVISLSVVFGVINIVLLTAISTLAAFLYNISSALVGGLQLTLTDD